MPAYSEIKVEIIEFSKDETIPIKLTLKNPLLPPPNFGVATDGVITTTGNYQIVVPRGKITGNKHEVKFWADRWAYNPDTNGAYQLVGIVFKDQDQTIQNSSPRGGNQMFKKVEISDEALNPAQPAVLTRVVTVTLDADEIRKLPQGGKKSYSFKLWVQRMSDGADGVIDPEWELEN